VSLAYISGQRHPSTSNGQVRRLWGNSIHTRPAPAQHSQAQFQRRSQRAAFSLFSAPSAARAPPAATAAPPLPSCTCRALFASSASRSFSLSTCEDHSGGGAGQEKVSWTGAWLESKCLHAWALLWQQRACHCLLAAPTHTANPQQCTVTSKTPTCLSRAARLATRSSSYSRPRACRGQVGKMGR